MACISNTAYEMTNLPHLQRLPEGRSHLIVDGEPFLMRAGELHNSSLSSASYMSLVWPNLLSMGLNTVLGSVSWEQIEPAEGSFDWTELDKVVQAAETHGIKLVLLWFGSFKNGQSQQVQAASADFQECQLTRQTGSRPILRDSHGPRLRITTMDRFAPRTCSRFSMLRLLPRTPELLLR